MKKLFFLLAVTICLFSCKKSSNSTYGQVEFYLLESFTNLSGKCQVDPGSAVLKTVPFISNQDIISYSGSAYTYTLSDAAMQTVKTFAGRQPFAVVLNDEVIFYGFYNSSFLSSSCEHSISLDADSGGDNKIILRLGYPGLLSGVIIDDERNNITLINTLKAQGKWRM